LPSRIADATTQTLIGAIAAETAPAHLGMGTGHHSSMTSGAASAQDEESDAKNSWSK